jgi:hypothetical protein
VSDAVAVAVAVAVAMAMERISRGAGALLGAALGSVEWCCHSLRR